MLSLNEYIDCKSVVQVSESLESLAESHVIYFNEDTNDVDVVLLDADGVVLECFSFSEIEYAEVFLEENFDVEVLPIDEYDLSRISEFKQLSESFNKARNTVLK